MLTSPAAKQHCNSTNHRGVDNSPEDREGVDKEQGLGPLRQRCLVTTDPFDVSEITRILHLNPTWQHSYTPNIDWN
ncbi:hypothetical protein HPP92_016066 [Vanilla planifolia]|uniref:Uncharacterized protein n=1 Tax=Vanilla planifolia TaxID=51239 RepID=A0A835UT04_VANPL|nr:hypothetical protein HPP92_016066 [Vanilla planifolia]